MSAVIASPSLREVIADALDEAYQFQRAAIEDCPACRKSPAGICPDREHQEAAGRAHEYEQARKRLRDSPGEVLAAIGAGEGGEAS